MDDKLLGPCRVDLSGTVQLTCKTFHHNDIAAELRGALLYVGLNPAHYDHEVYEASAASGPVGAWALPSIRRSFLRRILCR